jgi:hydroxymethylbilane synthase
MGWQSRVSEWLEPEVMLPAPGQGALAVEVRRDDPEILALLRRVDVADAREAVTAERALMGRLGTGCRAPAAALATVVRGRVVLDGLLAGEDGRVMRRRRGSAPVGAARWLGCCVADRLYADAGAVDGGLPLEMREPARRAT